MSSDELDLEILVEIIIYTHASFVGFGPDMREICAFSLRILFSFLGKTLNAKDIG